jgi:CMP-N-acetylneuraminate monooxygenase
MFKLTKPLNYKIEKNYIKIKLDEIKKGVNCFKDFIIVKKKSKYFVYDRICDHSNGRIVSKDNQHVCPMHNWKFDPISGTYANGFKKKEREFKLNKKFLEVENLKEVPKISKIAGKEKTKIRFFNHAFLKVEGKNFSFATDPWAFGPAFNTGWWLKHKTKKDWVDELNSCSFIYISHNHPDHLHPLTLSKLKKNIDIIVPKFSTDSTGLYLEELGFKNIHRLEFANEYRFRNSKLMLSILKSGDFREDSGIYFSNGDLDCLFSVDTASINFDRLPNVDLFASSFAGGASGFPLMFETIKKEEKKKILLKNKNFVKTNNCRFLKKTKASYYLPYAGFFEEKLSRDKIVANLQKKNQINDYKSYCKKNSIKLLNVEKNDEYFFNGKKLETENKKNIKFYRDISPAKYLKAYKENYRKIDLNYIKTYFEKSNFKDNLILTISLVDDHFKNSKLNFKVDFTGVKPKFSKMSKPKSILNKLKNIKQLSLKCRKESFLNTIYNKSPWEDLSIGFQCMVDRIPNEYNYKFWYHFTNKYITSKNVRSSTDCNSCEKLMQYFYIQTIQQKSF